MGDGSSGELSVEAYAAIRAALAAPGVDIEAVLAAHGLDEARWEALDREWQARLSEAEAAEGDGVPPLVAAYAEAFARAQRARAEAVSLELSFERYVELTRALRQGGDVAALLKKLEVGLDVYLAAHAHYAREMATNPELADRFTRALG